MTRAREVLEEVFGHRAFRSGQEIIVEDVIAGRDVLAVMPTGGGKSICFQVPALVRGGVTVAISPLLALMGEQVDTLRRAGVDAHMLASTTSETETEQAWEQAQSGGPTVLYMSPERATRSETLERLERLDVRLVAIDEAHCISQWGPAFRPDYARLSVLRAQCPQAPIVALTATADALTRDDIARGLLDAQARVHVMGFDRANIHLRVSAKRDWKEQIAALVRRREGQAGIVYCLSRARTEQCAEHLRDEGLNALAYHAGVEAAKRKERQKEFMEGPPIVMCATIAFGMGVDKPDVRFVAHADLPGNIEAYYQEIGRAGRDGARANAIMLFSVRDIEVRRRMIENEDSTPERKRMEHRRLDALLEYCESLTCRRQALLGYFAEQSEPCGNCDVCTDARNAAEAGDAARAVIGAVRSAGEKASAEHVAEIAAGRATKRVRALGHSRVPDFGRLRAHGLLAVESLVRQMVAQGVLTVDVDSGRLDVGRRGEQIARQGTGFLSRHVHDPVKEPPRQRPADGGAVRERLEHARAQLAARHGVPAMFIFSDATLGRIARAHPRDEGALRRASGFDAAQMRRFADALLDALRERTR